MYVIKFAFLFILVVTYYKYHVFWEKHYKTFQVFVTLDLRGGGGRLVQKGNQGY